MASAGRIKWTLFCSVCSKLKASQFICSRPRLTGAPYSHRNTVERVVGGAWWKRMRKISLLSPRSTSLSLFFSFFFGFVQVLTQLLLDGDGRSGLIG